MAISERKGLINALQTFHSFGGGYIYTSFAAKTSARRRSGRDPMVIEPAFPAGRILGAPASSPPALVLLPVDYGTDPGRRYPAVYILSDFRESAAECLDRAAERSFARDDAILVAVSGMNALGGGFYVDSALGGAWESYIVDRLVPAVDLAMRTRPEAAARSLAGRGMGGFGALCIGLSRPDIFSSVDALSPMACAPGGIRAALAEWNAAGTPMLRQAYQAAFDLGGGSLLPIELALSMDGGDEGLAREWERGLGGWENRLAACRAKAGRLPAISLRVEAGTAEWARRGAAAIQALLAA